MAKKKQEQVKLIILVILYLLLLPVTLIVFKLLPFIIANDTNIELSTFVTTILKHPINTFLEIIQSNYMIPFFIVQIIVLIILFVFLHPTKRGRIRNKRTKKCSFDPWKVNEKDIRKVNEEGEKWVVC